MTKQPAQEQAGLSKRDALKVKRTGQSSITMFVVFVISLLSFGQAPISRIAGTDGYRMNFNLFSCLGVAMGIFALIFLLTSYKRIMRLTKARKVLGLVGSIGLIVHTILALFLPLSYGASAVRPAGTAGYRPMTVSGAEQWIIDGKTYSISSTHGLLLPDGLQFTIEYPYRFSDADRNMDDARALEIVFPLMEHAYRHNLYNRATVTKLGQGKVVPSRIGVVLLDRQGENTRGYRVALSLDRVRERMGRGVAIGSDASPNPDGATP